MKLRFFVFSLCTVLIVSSPILACDGRDRYAKPGSATDLYFFPAPMSEMCGYRILPPETDDDGDADNERGFHWARAHSIALIRLAAYNTVRRFGPGPYDLAIFDLSAENGDTPISMKPGKPARARHPGNSHDGGINLDLSYYLTSLEGVQDDEDYAACSDHYLPPDPEKTESEDSGDEPRDAYQCRSAPDRLDLERQSYFFIQLFHLDQTYFNGEFIGPIGIDWEIQKVVLSQLETWKSQERYGVDDELIERIKGIFTANRYGGWARFHHHHIHLRLNDLPYRGIYRTGIDRILEDERAMDLEILHQIRPHWQSLLRTRVSSYAMSRAVEMEVIPGKSIETVQFRTGSGEWIESDPADFSRLHATDDLPGGPDFSETHISIQARITYTDGSREALEDIISLPARPPHLYIPVDPARVTTEWNLSEGNWTLTVDYPKIYDCYVTGIVFEVHRNDGKATTVEKLKPETGDRSVTFTEQETDNPICLIRARLICSGSLSVKVPVYIP